MIRWIAADLGTASFDEARLEPGVVVVDVRALRDDAGNPVDLVRRKIDEALAGLRAGSRVVVACDHGISRSNAIAAGALSLRDGRTFDDALRTVMDRTGETRLRIEVLAAVRAALGETAAPAGARADGVVVTGATGRLGRALVARSGHAGRFVLPQGDAVDLIDRVPQFEALVRSSGVRAVVHLAEPHATGTARALGDSLAMLRNVADVCRAARLHLVLVSSHEVFSGLTTTADAPCDESVPPLATTARGLAHLLCEQLIDRYARPCGVKATILRASTVYGPADVCPPFLRAFAGAAKDGRALTTHRFQNGRPRVDMLHVSDFVRAVDLALDVLPGETIHVARGAPVTTFDLARRLVDLAGSRSEVLEVEMDGVTSHARLLADRASRVLDWRPAVSLDDGIADVLA